MDFDKIETTVEILLKAEVIMNWPKKAPPGQKGPGPG